MFEPRQDRATPPHERSANPSSLSRGPPQQRPPSHRYQQEVQVGAVLPSSGVTYYEVPAEYGVRDYRYTVVNDRTVLVDPRTHRVIQIID
jgi:hypothetical protein